MIWPHEPQTTRVHIYLHGCTQINKCSFKRSKILHPFIWWNLPGIYVRFTSYLLNTHCMQSAINTRLNHWTKHQFWILPPRGRLTTNTWLALYSLCLILRCPLCCEAAEELSIHTAGENSTAISLTTAQCLPSSLNMKKKKRKKEKEPLCPPLTHLSLSKDPVKEDEPGMKIAENGVL